MSSPQQPEKKQSLLFEPVQLGDLHLKHRVVMAPLTRNRAKQPGNIPHDLNVKYYEQRASEGGLLITEATQITQGGQGYPRTPGIHSKEQIEGWKAVTNAVHAKKGLILCQLWHVGRVSHTSYQPDGKRALAPSEVAIQGQGSTVDGTRVPYEVPRAATLDDIKEAISQYKTAAENSKAAGFDGVEVHGANGYLINQFLEDNVNLRTDEYGGSIENRARFLFEALDAAIAGFGNSRRVGIRLSPWSDYLDVKDSNKFALYSYVLSRLEKYDLAYVHLVEPTIDNPDQKEQEVKRLRDAAKFTKNLLGCGNHSKDSATKSLEHGVLAAAVFGRLFLANPDLPRRLLLDAPFNPIDYTTLFTHEPKGYTDYPFYEEPAKAKA